MEVLSFFIRSFILVSLNFFHYYSCSLHALQHSDISVATFRSQAFSYFDIYFEVTFSLLSVQHGSLLFKCGSCVVLALPHTHTHNLSGQFDSDLMAILAGGEWRRSGSGCGLYRSVCGQFAGQHLLLHHHLNTSWSADTAAARY